MRFEAKFLSSYGPVEPDKLPAFMLAQGHDRHLHSKREKLERRKGSQVPNKSNPIKASSIRFFKKFYWDIVDLQCSVSFRYTA